MRQGIQHVDRQKKEACMYVENEIQRMYIIAFVKRKRKEASAALCVFLHVFIHVQSSMWMHIV